MGSAEPVDEVHSHESESVSANFADYTQQQFNGNTNDFYRTQRASLKKKD